MRSTGHSPTAWGTGEIDPKASFLIGQLNERKAPKSGPFRSSSLERLSGWDAEA
jgi:hypothetical protein